MACEAYVTFEGTKQGKFHSETLQGHSKFEGSRILNFEFPVEWLGGGGVHSGHATGKRQWGPIKIVKEWGAASPQLLGALASHESLKVKLQFTKPSQDGKETVYYTIQLTNALIELIQPHHSPQHKGKALHEITLSYQGLHSTGHFDVAGKHAMV